MNTTLVVRHLDFPISPLPKESVRKRHLSYIYPIRPEGGGGRAEIAYADF